MVGKQLFFGRTALHKISSVVNLLVEVDRVLSGAVMAVKSQRQGAFAIGRGEKRKGVKGGASGCTASLEAILYVLALSIAHTVERKDDATQGLRETVGD
jgi:hypothetical protein